MNILTLTVGLPRSGKSTWAKNQRVPVVNPDSIRLAVHGQPYRQESEPLVWAMAHIMVESLFRAGHTQVILDATSVEKTRRKEWKSPLWVRKYQVFPTSANICKQRAAEGGRNYLIPVIDKMNAVWEPIDDDDWD
jgi:predicted kinase